MYVCMHIYIYVYMYIYVYIYMYVYMYIYNIILVVHYVATPYVYLQMALGMHILNAEINTGGKTLYSEIFDKTLPD